MRELDKAWDAVYERLVNFVINRLKEASKSNTTFPLVQPFDNLDFDFSEPMLVDKKLQGYFKEKIKETLQREHINISSISTIVYKEEKIIKL